MIEFFQVRVRSPGVDLVFVLLHDVVAVQGNTDSSSNLTILRIETPNNPQQLLRSLFFLNHYFD